MSTIKEVLFNLMEQDADWATHRAEHAMSPDPSCGYCCQSADVPEEVLEGEAYE